MGYDRSQICAFFDGGADDAVEEYYLRELLRQVVFRSGTILWYGRTNTRRWGRDILPNEICRFASLSNTEKVVILPSVEFERIVYLRSNHLE